MKRSYKVSISSEGFSTLLHAVEEYEAWLEERSRILLERLADLGCENARVRFGEAEYDGTNDVEVHVEPKGDRVAAVVATGQAVLFIEFGTGVSYPDSHPEAGVNGFQHGGYGHHLGALPDGWRYPLENGLGTNGTIDADHPGYAHTYGNQANMSMYNTVKMLREKLPELAREVFSS